MGYRPSDGEGKGDSGAIRGVSVDWSLVGGFRRDGGDAGGVGCFLHVG